jgi:hypothetical protein
MARNNAEILRSEMMAAGDRLLLALTVELESDRIALGNDVRAIRRHWRECRGTVERLAEDYTIAIDRWRTVVEDATGVDSPSQRRGRVESSELFQTVNLRAFGLNTNKRSPSGPK